MFEENDNTDEYTNNNFSDDSDSDSDSKPKSRFKPLAKQVVKKTDFTKRIKF